MSLWLADNWLCTGFCIVKILCRKIIDALEITLQEPKSATRWNALICFAHLRRCDARSWFCDGVIVTAASQSLMERSETARRLIRSDRGRRATSEGKWNIATHASTDI